jgi:WD40 repeat protein
MARGTLEGHFDQVTAVAFPPDGQLVASGSWDSIVWLWDAKTERLLQPFDVGGVVYNLSFSVDGLCLKMDRDQIKLTSLSSHTQNQSMLSSSPSSA